MKVSQELIKWIKQDSKVSISTAGLVGDKFVEISGGSINSKLFNPETDVLESEDIVDVKNIISKGEDITLLTEKILTRLDRILLKVEEQQFFSETMSSIKNSAKNMELITAELKKAELGMLMKNINLGLKNVNHSSLTLSNILQRVESVS